MCSCSQLLQSCGRIHDKIPIALRLATASLIISPQFFFSGTYERRTIRRHAGFVGPGKIAGENLVVHRVVWCYPSLPVWLRARVNASLLCSSDRVARIGGRRSDPALCLAQATRTDFGRPSSSMRFKARTAMAAGPFETATPRRVGTAGTKAGPVWA